MAAEPVIRWQPIALAPRDGRELVVTDFAAPMEFASWQTDVVRYTEGGFWSCRDARRRALPSHFVDLTAAAQTA